MSSHIMRYAACALLLTACATAGVRRRAAPSPVPADSILPRVLSGPAAAVATLPPGTMDGLILDQTSGSPVRGAQVYHVGTARGALSDSQGRFRLDSLPVGRVRVDVRRIGYASAALDVDVPPRRGLAAVVPLRAARTILCPLRIPPYPLLEVQVRTYPTGAAPPTGATLRVETSRGSEVGRRVPGADTALVLVALSYGTPDSVVRMYVTSPGYHPWEARDITLQPSGCGGFDRRPVDVWLLPQE